MANLDPNTIFDSKVYNAFQSINPTHTNPLNIVEGMYDLYTLAHEGKINGRAYRGIGADLFNADVIAQEDFDRAEKSAEMQMQRDKELIDYQNAFNAIEAEKQREFEKEMSNTSYQRMVNDLRLAGLNPILAYQNGGASTPAGAVATSGSSSGTAANAGYKGRTANTSQLVGSMLILAGQILQIQSGKTHMGKIGFGD